MCPATLTLFRLPHAGIEAGCSARNQGQKDASGGKILFCFEALAKL